MLADPQTVTVNAVPISLPKIDDRPTTNVYADLVGGSTLYTTQRVTGKDNRRRSSASLQKEKIAADALTAINARINGSATFSVAYPTGFTTTEIEQQAVGLITWLTANSNANLKKIIAGER
jgi:CRISPR/Cas system type I-B associated protein Csh2 (Cas7 group RAMP superfamily)